MQTPPITLMKCRC